MKFCSDGFIISDFFRKMKYIYNISDSMNFNKTNPYYNFEEKRQYDYLCCNKFINKFSPRNRINRSIQVDKHRRISKINLDPTFIDFIPRKYFFKSEKSEK